MPQNYSSYKTFLSSPSDVDTERSLAVNTLQHMDTICRDTLHISLEIKRWEDLTPMLPNVPIETIQDIINKEIGSCHFYVLIMNKRYGSIESGQTKSNTEREIDEILKHCKQNPKKKLLVYFRRPENNPDPGQQEQKVVKLKQRLA